MNTDQTLLLQALKAKQLQTQGFTGPGDLLGQLIEGQEQVKAKMHNICAFITPDLFRDIENVAGILDLSKRQIVEMALVDFVAKANAVIGQVDVFESSSDEGRPLVEEE